ncbi:MAG: phospholipase D-like domain-containing protein [Balneolales bacterium]|nr:phospholipase D-like domain-containing protein [Balneolales bacterium]
MHSSDPNSSPKITPGEKQTNLFADQPLPENEKFPLNAGQYETLQLIKHDIKESENYTIITGYSSVGFIIEVLGDRLGARNCIRIVLGNEPLLPASIEKYYSGRKITLPEQIRQFWLDKGISVTQNGKVLNLIQKMEFGQIEVSYLTNLHAKVYKGDGFAMLGSSNFSSSGMRTQLEANVRKEFPDSDFYEIGKIADYYLEKALPWNEEFRKLLEKLLKNVSWEEALARALMLILEGDWMQEYSNLAHINAEKKLWPIQRSAISQALYILDREGSVLIADPTGSGKTRTGAWLMQAIVNRLWRNSVPHRTKFEVICPPLVADNWVNELQQLNHQTSDPISHGMLSGQHLTQDSPLRKRLRDAHILLVDEAHNYLNKESGRSRSVVMNNADHLVLFTATPLNRKSDDLLRLVEILGLDNLSEEAFKVYRQLSRRRNKAEPEQLEKLREYVRRFMVRRTKKQLNAAIDLEPEAYRDADGKPCRFPKTRSLTYNTHETQDDIQIASEINTLISEKLRGIIYLKNIHAAPHEQGDEMLEKRFLDQRISMASALSRYNIRNLLRSSRAALYEHLNGTKAAMKEYDIDLSFKSTNTGDIISRIAEYSTQLPGHNLTIALPEWLSEPGAWGKACEEEIATLKEINRLVKKMSGERERAKAQKLSSFIKQKTMVLAYDSALITLHIIKKELDAMGFRKESVVVTGSDTSAKKELKKLFARDATQRGMAALCSDALAEGVNLQRASTVLFLDMPTVIRVAEQRIGRAERMDSPHSEISVYWPDDSPEFQLRTDRNFYFRHKLVETLLGSNITLPESISDNWKQTRKDDLLNTSHIIEGFEQIRESDDDSGWEGFEDAFSMLRKLVGDDNKASEPLIPKETYEDVKKASKGTGTWISTVNTRKAFCFMAIRGTKTTAPYWLLRRPLSPAERKDELSATNGKINGFFSSRNSAFTTDLTDISGFLSSVLPDSTQADFNKEAEKAVAQEVEWLSQNERSLLPVKKQNALKQLDKLSKDWLKQLEKEPQKDSRLRQLKDIQNLFRNTPETEVPDWYELAGRWLDWVQPRFLEWISEGRKRRKRSFDRLSDYTPELKKTLPDPDMLKALLRDLPKMPRSKERIAALILGLKHP